MVTLADSFWRPFPRQFRQPPIQDRPLAPPQLRHPIRLELARHAYPRGHSMSATFVARFPFRCSASGSSNPASRSRASRSSRCASIASPNAFALRITSFAVTSSIASSPSSSRRLRSTGSSPDLTNRGTSGLPAETRDAATNPTSVPILDRLSALGSPPSSQS